MKKRSGFLLKGLALLLSLSLLPAYANQAETERKLRALKSQISEVQKQLSGQRRERSREHDALRAVEKRIGSLERDINQTQEQLGLQQRRLRQLQGERQQLQGQLQEQEALIGQQILSAYQLGTEKKLKLLLNQEAPDHFTRALTYYDYFNRARLEEMETYLKTIRELDAITPAITAQTRELQQSRDRLQQQRADLQKEIKQRESALAALDRDIGRTGSKLEQMNAEQRELQRLLETLQEEITELALPSDYQPFNSRRGKMNWPAAGRRLNSFGAPRDGSSMRWQGIQIAASAGADVKAIHHGRVVFADWLRGMGLLLIIDHGDGYMSLYGHNQSLLRDTGDWVAAGETVATVGNSGGREQAGLYFEIRHRGRPADPVVWCRR